MTPPLAVTTASLAGLHAHATILHAAARPASDPGFTARSRSLADAAERVYAAFRAAAISLPPTRYVLEIAPHAATGEHMELPLAVAMLAAAGEPVRSHLKDYLIVGGVSLDGTLRPVPGVTLFATAARRAGLKGLIVPADNAGEALAVGGLEVRHARTLRQVHDFLLGSRELASRAPGAGPIRTAEPEGDMADVRGQEHVKRALEVACAGGHSIFLTGLPGAGKTMLARLIPSILPPLSPAETEDATRIHSLAGLLSNSDPTLTIRPFREPSHLLPLPDFRGARGRPGELSLTHHGVLFIDDLQRLSRAKAEILARAAEDGFVRFGSADQSSLPARFTLVAAIRPCPCGYHAQVEQRCRCSPAAINRYLQVMVPMLDRTDLHCDLPAVLSGQLEGRTRERSASIRTRLARARAAQHARFRTSPGVFANAHMTPREIAEHCAVSDDGNSLLRTAVRRLGLSARGYFRILQVARTIADLDGRETLEVVDIAEAIAHRSTHLTRFAERLFLPRPDSSA